MLRPVTLRRYLLAMRAQGFSVESVLAGSGIDAARLEDEDYLVDSISHQRVVENIVRLTGDKGIGLDVGLRHQYSDFGVHGFAALTAPNLLGILGDLWNRHNETIGLLTRLSIVRLGEQRLCVDIDVAATSEPVYRFFIEESLMILTNVAAEMDDRPPPLPEQIEFAFPEPPYGARYRELFHCPIHFNAARSRAIFRSEWFEQPLKTSNPELQQFCEQRMELLRQQVSSKGPTGPALRTLLLRRRGLPPTLDEAAREMGVSSRTLSRQLQQQGTSYRKEVERVQIDQALDLIKVQQKSAREISEAIGFADVNAFRRAFKRWTGMTVREYLDATVIS